MMNVELKGLDKALLMLDSKMVRKAAKFAINDGLDKSKTAFAAEIYKDWFLKKGRIKKSIRKVKRANNNSLMAIVRITSRPINLIEFSGAKHVRGRITTTAKKSTFSERTKKTGGVFVKIRKTPGKFGGSGQVRLPHSFIAAVNGKSLVFERKGKASLPIRSRSIITIASMADQDGVLKPTIKQVFERMDARFDHHLKRFTR